MPCFFSCVGTVTAGAGGSGSKLFQKWRTCNVVCRAAWVLVWFRLLSPTAAMLLHRFVVSHVVVSNGHFSDAPSVEGHKP